MTTQIEDGGLAGDIRQGLAWSTLNNLVLRAGLFAVGIALARLLTPEQFGLYAVALTVQAVLMTLADLGLSADLIRSKDPERIAPTVGALGLISGLVLATVMLVTSGPLAELLGSPDSAEVIALLAVTLVLAGAGVVPYAMLGREFRQKTLFMIAVVDFLISTIVTIGLVTAGWGVISLAIARIAAQSVTLVLQFWLSGRRPRYSIDWGVAGSVMRFGVPVASANMLSWLLLSLDNVVIARVAGPVALGYYFLAFNISNWPMSAIGQVVRSISLPAFARISNRRNDPSLATGVALSWALALPAGALLAVLATPLIELVYGSKWSPAAPVLAALGLFGALRVVFDLMASYLLARGASRAVLRVQVVWFFTLLPAMAAGTHWYGIVGGGWAHLVVAVVVVLPCYLFAAHKAGADIRRIGLVTWQPIAAAIPAATASFFASRAFEQPLLAFLIGGMIGALTYLVLIHRWLRKAVDLAGASTPHDPVEPAVNAHIVNTAQGTQ